MMSESSQSSLRDFASISLDVDALRFYGAIHGLNTPIPADEDPIYSVALDRFFDLLSEVNISGTIFFIAKDLHAAQATLTLGLKETNSELASHSYAHNYRLSQLSRSELEADLFEAHEALSTAWPGGQVVGFRAPGYNTSADMLETILRLGYTYDSSLLPSPAYFAARAATIASYRFLGHPSASLVGDVRAFNGPSYPYMAHPWAPWRPHAEGRLVELPMAVEPTTKAPVFGTSWTLMPERLRYKALERTLAMPVPFVFEMHAIDLLDATDPGVPSSLASHQPGLKTPAREKMAAFRGLFRTLAHQRTVQRLDQMAQSVRDHTFLTSEAHNKVHQD